MLFPSQETAIATRVFERVQQSRAELALGTVPTPFIDIMTVGSVQQKLAVIALISKQFEPMFSEPLQMGLRDSNNGVRVLAATAVAGIEKRFVEDTSERVEDVRQHPQDLEKLSTLGSHYDNYAFTGILDSAREKENRDKALEIYRRILDLHPQEVDMRMSVGRILIRQKRFEEARASLQDSILHGVSSPKMLVWLAECEYQLGNWTRVREILESNREQLSQEDFPTRILDAIKLWSQSSDGNLQAELRTS